MKQSLTALVVLVVACASVMADVIWEETFDNVDNWHYDVGTADGADLTAGSGGDAGLAIMYTTGTSCSAHFLPNNET